MPPAKNNSFVSEPKKHGPFQTRLAKIAATPGEVGRFEMMVKEKTAA